MWAKYLKLILILVKAGKSVTVGLSANVTCLRLGFLTLEWGQLFLLVRVVAIYQGVEHLIMVPGT